MPITFILPSPASKPVLPFSFFGVPISPSDFLNATSKSFPQCKQILSHSFTNAQFPTSLDKDGVKKGKYQVYPAQNGFVSAVIKAWSENHGLLIRPDDVWVAILVHLNLYIGGHAEELRQFFGERDNTEPWQVKIDADCDGATLMPAVAKHLRFQMIKDPKLRMWVKPGFSTSTMDDEIVCDVALVGEVPKVFSWNFPVKAWPLSNRNKWSWNKTLVNEEGNDTQVKSEDNDNQENANHTEIRGVNDESPNTKKRRRSASFSIPRSGPGVPFITLHGEKRDWQMLLQKCEKLSVLGEDTKTWAMLLEPVLKRFVKAFEKPRSEDNLKFWQQMVADHGSGGIWPKLWCGWITAFCFWDSCGNRLYDVDTVCLHDGNPCVSVYGQLYHHIEIEDVPIGHVQTSVRVKGSDKELESVVIAGSVGIEATSGGRRTRGGGILIDTLQPILGWWMFEKKVDKGDENEGNGDVDIEGADDVTKDSYEAGKEGDIKKADEDGNETGKEGDAKKADEDGNETGKEGDVKKADDGNAMGMEDDSVEIGKDDSTTQVEETAVEGKENQVVDKKGKDAVRGEGTSVENHGEDVVEPKRRRTRSGRLWF